MLHKHLNDETIQDYLDGNLPDRIGEIEKHLHICKTCQLRVKEYKQIYEELAKEIDFNLANNFSETVVSRLNGKGSKIFTLHISDTLLSTILFIACTGILFFFLDFNVIWQSISTIQIPNFTFVTYISSFVQTLLTQFKTNLIFLTAAAVTLLFITLDRIIIYVRVKHSVS